MSTYGNVAVDPTNNPSDKPVRTRSRFPSLSYHFYNTERFGEYSPSFVMDCVEGDKVPVRSGGRVSTYSLKAPLMQSLFKKKDFYMVPMEAILPLNWQKFYTNPVVGDDVPDDCGTGYENFWHDVYLLSTGIFSQVKSLLASPGSYTADNVLTAIFRCAIIAEYFYSSGSLLNSLGCRGFRYARFVDSNQVYSFDSWFDQLMSAVIAAVPVFDFSHDGTTYVVVNDEANYGYCRYNSRVVSFRTFLQMMRDDLTTYVNYSAASLSDIITAVSPFFDSSTTWKHYFVDIEVNYDLRRLWAYQLVVSHFYSNDHIDYIYSADLFRSLISFFVTTTTSGNSTNERFTCNGIPFSYDYLSSHYTKIIFTRFLFSTVISSILVDTTGSDNAFLYRQNILGYFSALFAYRRSLRYVDYFTGSRSRPLAVGDVNVNVNSNLVNVVDVSRNIQRQRFFNAVNRFGRKFEEYIKGLSGITPDTDWHNPLYLAHTSDTVYGVEVENTGVAQQQNANSITSRLMTNGSRYQFEFEVDRPCVVIGISYYDLPRAYLFNTERQLFHLNRFDMFNPYMQFIGDQSVDFAELGCDVHFLSNPTFGYQLRHMEYKQRYDQAAGGFYEDLPGFLFTDKNFGSFYSYNVDPGFIRSLNSELDDFYVALTGYSLGHYFHFIVDNDITCDASRPMAFAPSIL